LEDKIHFLPAAEIFRDLGFQFVGTAGTAKFLKERGFKCEKVFKISEGKSPNVIDVISKKKVSMVINTANKFSHDEISDGYLIRRAAIDANTPLIKNPAIARILAKSLKKFPAPEDCPILSYEERDEVVCN